MPSKTTDLTEIAFETYHAPTQIAEKTSVQQTQEARTIIKANFPETCDAQYPSVSPDGNWLAEDCNELRVVNRDGQKKIVIKYEAFKSLPDEDIGGLPPVYWSKDSQYFYFTIRFCCADTDASGWDGPLYRLDIQTSERIKMTAGYFNYYSFSPTGRRLLHIPNDQGSGPPVGLHIFDLKTDTEQTLNLNTYEQAGSVLWKPDGTQFVISAQIGNFFEQNSQFALLLVSLNDLSITNLIPLGRRERLFAANWSDDNVLTIIDCALNSDYREICKSYPYDLKAVPQFIFPTAKP